MHYLHPIWIGIAFNLLMLIFNVSCIGHDNRFITWYMGRGAYWIMGAVWAVLLFWSFILWRH